MYDDYGIKNNRLGVGIMGGCVIIELCFRFKFKSDDESSYYYYYISDPEMSSHSLMNKSHRVKNFKTL